MGNKTLNAIGVEMKFMPQPDNTYQERIAEVQGVRGATPASSSADMLAKAADDLNANWMNFITDREKRMNEEGLTEANQMISQTTQQDREKLNTLDIAMTYGFGSNVDNPYFIAYSDKLRGQAMGDDAKLAYAEQYGDTPAPTPDLEVQRYSNFVQKYREKYNRGQITNDVAFDTGFYDQNIENQKDLMSNHVQRDIQDRIGESFNNIKSQLGKFVYDMPSMSRVQQAQKLTEIFAQAKLMALNPEQRQWLVDNTADRIIQTGTITDFKSFVSDVLDKVPVQTRLDGSSLMMGDLVDKMLLFEKSTEYRKAHVSQEKLDFIKKHSKDPDMTSATQELIRLQRSPERADRAKGEILEATLGEVSQAQHEHKVAQARFAKVGGRNVKVAATSQASAEAARENLRAFMNSDGGVMFDGYHNTIGKPMIQGKAVDAETMLAIEQEYLGNIMASDTDEATKGSQMMKLLSYPGMDSIKGNLRDSIMNTINSSTEQDVLQNGVPSSVMALIRAREANKGQFVGVFGPKIDAAISAIKTFAGLSGEGDANSAYIRGFANYCRIKDIDDDKKHAIYAQIDSWKNYTVGGMDNWGKDGTYADAISVSDPQLYGGFRERAFLLMCNYNDIGSALNGAGSDYAENYAYYHGAVFPKNCFNSGLGSSEPYYAKQALEAYMGMYAKQFGAETEDMNVTYDADSGSWTFSDPNSGNSVVQTAADMRNEILYIVQKETEDAQNQTEYTTTPASTGYTPTETEKEVADNSGSIGDAIVEQTKDTPIGGLVRSIHNGWNRLTGGD